MGVETHVPEPHDDRDVGKPRQLPFAGFVRSFAFGIAGAAMGLAACLALWLIFGGWGPPFPLVFAGLGFVLGIVASFARPAVKRRAK